MAECECFRMTCAAFFSGGAVVEAGIAEVFKQRYCQGLDRDSCARLLVHNELGPYAVPHDLWPNHVASAATLLTDSGR